MADHFKDHLTTEDLSEKFTNQFELVAYAIRLAENMLKTGRDPRIKTDVQNRALQVLEEIATGKDYFDEIVIVPEQPVEAIFSTKTSVVLEKNIIEKDFEKERPPRPKTKSKSSNNALLDDKKSKRTSSRRALAK